MTDPSGPQFVLGGRTDPGSSPLYQGRDGNYWSSSAYTSATYAYRLLLSSTDSSVLPARYSPKLLGFPLRCLAQKGMISLKTLRLPTGNTTGEFQSLYNQYPTYDQMRKYPVGMVLGGRYYWSDGTLNYQGTYGLYWSSSAYTSATDAYQLYLDGLNSAVLPADDSDKRNGRTLRCLAPLHQKRRRLQSQTHATSQPVALLENTKLSTITIITMML